MKGGESMDINVVLSAITTVGFPIVMCGSMAWYVKYITDQHRADRLSSEQMFKESISEVTVALNNNTVALQKLVVKIGDEEC